MNTATQATPIQTNFFDYTALDTETCIVVKQRTDEIKALMKRTAQGIIEIGQKLIEVKGRLEHGMFMGWLKTEVEPLGLSYYAANRWMNVATKFCNLQNLNQRKRFILNNRVATI